ncbi:MAG: LysR family transcriptional regulator [Kordiimonadaceae bacterium]|nr:LysR family transcriptional regulator [Kordiimonadaceae bacterium]
MQIWNGIEEFVRVVEKGSFSEAAKAMGLSKSHISKHIKKLENRLGVTLIHRTTRKLKITNQGQEFFLKCQAIIHDMEESQAQLANEITNPRGLIRLTVAGAFGEDFLSPLIAKFQHEFPEVSIDITFTNRRVDLLEEQFDLAIRSSIDMSATPNGERLFSHPLVTAASPDYLSKHGAPPNINNLKLHNCLCGTLPRWRFQVGGNIREVTVTGNWHANNGRALVHAAKVGLGIIQVPNFYVTEALSTGDLTEILAPARVENNSFWAIYPKSHHVPRKTQMLVDFIRDNLNQNHPH